MRQKDELGCDLLGLEVGLGDEGDGFGSMDGWGRHRRVRRGERAVRKFAT